MKRLAMLAALLLVAAGRVAYAYDHLQVLDPQQTWRSAQGTIEEAVLSIHPKGLYLEYGLYLTFSARGSGFRSNDVLEVAFHFDLPEGVLVHDSWLWVGDQIMQARLVDQWTASSIYENIVNRRRDPSVLFKRSATEYELRVYPMRGNEKRRVKLTYLVPTGWSPEAVTAALPVNLLQASATRPNLTLLTWLSPEWKSPQVVGASGVAFVPREDPAFGSYLEAKIPAAALSTGLALSLAAPLRDGVYLNRYDAQEEGLYQLAFLPLHALDAATNRRVAILLDYDAANTTIPARQLLDQVKAFLHTYFDAGDTFNLILSQLNIRRASETWLPADAATIDRTFAALGANPLASYSNLPSLLGNAVEFIKANGNEGSILLLSDASQVGDYLRANQLLRDVMGAATAPIQVHIADFQNQNVQYLYIGGQAYAGNEYFYTNLARLTAGNYVNLRTTPVFERLLPDLVQSLDGLITSFDLHTTLANGFAYGRLSNQPNEATAQVYGPVLQVGKYRGSFPFVIEASGVYRGSAFSRTIEIPAGQAYAADSLNETIWSGRYLQRLERGLQSNTTIGEIIDLSIRSRVLSLYTAFLALEPSDTLRACLDCVDESDAATGVEDGGDELPSDTLTLEAYPNPFRDRTTIEVTFAREADVREATVAVYDLLGRVVRRFPLDAPAGRTARLAWDGTTGAGEPVASGVYLCVVTTPSGRHTLKLVRVR